MGRTFAEKFEAALEERKQREPGFGLRTLARELADRPENIETIRRRLQKYRPKGPSGAAEVTPTPPTRWEIEKALGLDRDALKTDEELVAALYEEAARAALTERKARVLDEMAELYLGAAA